VTQELARRVAGTGSGRREGVALPTD
jgi:hypothetical protein